VLSYATLQIIDSYWFFLQTFRGNKKERMKEKKEKKEKRIELN